MKGLDTFVRRVPEYQGILETVQEQYTRKNPLPLLVNGLCDGARFAFYCALCADWKAKTGNGILILVPEEKQILRLKNAFAEVGMKALSYPLRDFVFHNMTASHEYEQERLRVLKAICDRDFDVILATPDAAVQFTMPKAELNARCKTIRKNEECSQEDLLQFLQSSGYNRVDLVDGAGQYAHRGGIIDFYPPNAGAPIRLDFFDTEIDQISVFDVMTQRRTDSLESVTVMPTQEVLLTSERRKELYKTIASQLTKATDADARSALQGELDALERNLDLSFLDKYLTWIYPQSECLLDYAARNICICVEDDSAIHNRLKGYTASVKQTIEDMVTQKSIAPSYASYCLMADQYSAALERHVTLCMELFTNSISHRAFSGMYHFLTKQTVSYYGHFDLLCEDLQQYQKTGYACTVLCENERSANEIAAQLREAGLRALASETEQDDAVAQVVYGKNLAGFEMTQARYACLSLYQTPNSLARSIQSRHRSSKKKNAQQILSYADLKVGDYVVHINHGIGRYLGLETLTVGGATREFIKLQYAGTDTLYLPCEQLEHISKYIGAKSEDGTLKLSRIGGEEWGKTKARAKGAAKEMAKELIALYAQRMRREGHAYPPDDTMQKEFEIAFEYEETDGQLQASQEIKADMEKIQPMERLLCGDVGFGKTEVAMRAAFKAVSDGKQVAVLVPTTILAMQHYQTFRNRMRSFPVQVDVLSRFRSPNQQKETLRKLARGETDIIIGTHRLLSDDVAFRDLGLVIVDEEQRFGVGHKEKLKQISQNVDALTLTATPIPRTLNMAMSGIRDMSILDEAPIDRMPVQSYVLEYDETILAEAIRKELRRGGQVFYLYNKVETIQEAAARVSRWVPDARVAMAHGQMDREEISDIWAAMVAGEIDILVSTTIIETGIDIPNANTLIIENADGMGLSQLHQIRGRIGRSSRRAYAYFTYPAHKVLTEIAAKRLSAIREYTEFGSGFKVAMRDLEIRGAGNLLGAEQHGHITTIGYDLYMRLLNEAVLEERGELQKPKPECAITISVSAFLPNTFISSAAQRIDAYKRISLIRNTEDLMDVTDELVDRYGDIPKPVENLLDIAALKADATEAGIVKIEEREGAILIRPSDFQGILWMKLAAEYRGRIMLNVGQNPYIACPMKKGDPPLLFLRKLLKHYLELRNERQEKKGE